MKDGVGMALRELEAEGSLLWPRTASSSEALSPSNRPHTLTHTHTDAPLHRDPRAHIHSRVVRARLT